MVNNSSLLTAEMIDNLISNTDADTSIFVIQESLGSFNNNNETRAKSIEANLRQLKMELDKQREENLILRKECDYLKSKLGENVESDDDDSMMAYIDVHKIRISHRIEHCLLETNKIFANKTKMRESLEYLIKSIWSLVAHEYSDSNLDLLKLTKDDLLKKLKKCEDENVNLESMFKSQVKLSDEMDVSLNNELDNVKTETYCLRMKVLKQNEAIKKFIKEIELKKNKASVDKETQTQKLHDFNVKSVGLETNEDDNYHDISPSTSPTSFFIDRFKETLDKYSIRNSEAKKDYAINDESIIEKEESFCSAKEDQTPVESKFSQFYNKFFSYYLSDFVAIGKISDKSDMEKSSGIGSEKSSSTSSSTSEQSLYQYHVKSHFNTQNGE